MIRDALDPDAQLGPLFPRADAGVVPNRHPMHALDERRNRALAEAAQVEEQERERARAQQASLAADEAARAAQLQRVLEATGATPVNLNEVCRRLRAGSSQPQPIIPNPGAIQ